MNKIERFINKKIDSLANKKMINNEKINIAGEEYDLNVYNRILRIKESINEEQQIKISTENLVFILKRLINYVGIKTYLDKYKVMSDKISTNMQIDLFLSEVPEDVIYSLCCLELSHKTEDEIEDMITFDQDECPVLKKVVHR